MKTNYVELLFIGLAVIPEEDHVYCLYHSRHFNIPAISFWYVASIEGRLQIYVRDQRRAWIENGPVVLWILFLIKNVYPTHLFTPPYCLHLVTVGVFNELSMVTSCIMGNSANVKHYKMR